MRKKVLYMTFATCLLMANTSISFANVKKNEESPDIAKLKAKIENVMSQVDKQPDWLYSRLQMFWTTNATDVFVHGESFSHPGGTRAAEPTVKYNGTRSVASQYNRPKLEDIIPYDDDERGCVTYVNRATGIMEKTSPAKTGCNIAGVNRQILGIARDAARIYAATDDMRYGRMVSSAARPTTHHAISMAG